MPRCKKADCYEEALPYGKRYCPEHKREYERKQREFDRISATLRCCDRCGEKLTKTGHDRGDLYCRTCGEHFLREAEAERIADEREKLRQIIRKELHAAETVADLRDWIEKYVLGI